MNEFKYSAGDCFYQEERVYNYFILVQSPFYRKGEKCYHVLSFVYDENILQRIELCYSRQNDLSKKKYVGNYKHLTGILCHSIAELDSQLI